MDNINNNYEFAPCNIWNDVSTGNSVRGGNSNELLYQERKNVTGFLPNGTDNQILTAKTMSKPEWTDGDDITVGTAKNLSGGVNQQLLIQTNPDTTSFLPVGGAYQTLSTNLHGVVQWTHAAYLAADLSNGVLGNIPYQAAASNTAFLENGTSGQVLTCNGNAAPSWETLVSGETLENVLITGDDANGQQIQGFRQLVSDVIDVRAQNLTMTNYVDHAPITQTVTYSYPWKVLHDIKIADLDLSGDRTNARLLGGVLTQEIRCGQYPSTTYGSIKVTEYTIEIWNRAKTVNYLTYHDTAIEGQIYALSGQNSLSLPSSIPINGISLALPALPNETLQQLTIRVNFQYDIWVTFPSLYEEPLLRVDAINFSIGQLYDAPKISRLVCGMFPLYGSIEMIHNSSSLKVIYSCPDLTNLFSQEFNNNQNVTTAQEGTAVGTFSSQSFNNTDNYWIVPPNFGLIAYNNFEYAGNIVLNYKNTTTKPQMVKPTSGNASSSVRVFYADIEQILNDDR